MRMRWSCCIFCWPLLAWSALHDRRLRVAKRYGRVDVARRARRRLDTSLGFLNSSIGADWEHDLTILKQILAAWPGLEELAANATSLCEFDTIVTCDIDVYDVQACDAPLPLQPMSPLWWRLRRVRELKLCPLGGSIPAGAGGASAFLTVLDFIGRPDLGDASAGFPGYPNEIPPDFWHIRGLSAFYVDDWFGLDWMLPSTENDMQPFCEHLEVFFVVGAYGLIGDVRIFSACTQLSSFVLQETAISGNPLAVAIPHMTRGPCGMDLLVADGENLHGSFPQSDAIWKDWCSIPRCEPYLEIDIYMGLEGPLPKGLDHCGPNITALVIKKLPKFPGLQGPISHLNLSHWTSLVWFDLTYQSLNGTLPCLPAQIEKVDFFVGNSFSGGIPLCWGALKRLRTIDLHENRLSGPPFPWGWMSDDPSTAYQSNSNADWSNIYIEPPDFPMLSSLDLSNNPLNISIPFFFSTACHFSGLRTIKCQHCELYGGWEKVTDWGSWYLLKDNSIAGLKDGCTELEALDLSDNRIRSFGVFNGNCYDGISSIFATSRVNERDDSLSYYYYYEHDAVTLGVLRSLALAGNPLHVLHPYFYDIQSLDLSRTDMHAPVSIREADCASDPSQLEAVCMNPKRGPLSRRTCMFASDDFVPSGSELHECASMVTIHLETGNLLNLEVDPIFNRSSLCRCTPGSIPIADRGTPETCQLCGENFYAGPRDQRCTRCPEKSSTLGFRGKSGLVDCKCQAGHVMFMSTCVPCPLNTWSTTIGATNFDVCIDCPPTLQTLRVGTTSKDGCTCSKGSTRVNASAPCRLCPKGRSKGTIGSNPCSMCKIGTYAPQAGLLECIVCPFGRYAREMGQSDCEFCQFGRFVSIEASSACEPCPQGFTSLTGSSSPDQCICPAGFFFNGQGSCEACPDGMACLLGSSITSLVKPSLSTPSASNPCPMGLTCTSAHGATHACPLGLRCRSPLAEAGFMARSQEPLLVYQCMSDVICPGGLPGTCSSNRNIDAIACGKCKQDAYESELGHCKPCVDETEDWPIIVAAVVGVTLLVGLAFAYNRDAVRQRDSATTADIISSLTWKGFQTLGIIQSLGLSWIDPLRTASHVSAQLNFNLQALRLECSGVDLVMKFLGRQLLGPCCLVIVAVALVLKKLHMRRIMFLRQEMSNTFGVVFSMFFISMTVSALEPMICYKHPGNVGDSMVSAPSVLCYKSDVHKALFFIGLVSFTLMPLPFLCLCVFSAILYEHYILHSKSKLPHFRFLFGRFRSGAHCYGLFWLIRSLFLCLVPVIIQDQGICVCLIAIILLGFVFIQLHLQPWRLVWANIADGATSCSLIFTLMCGAVATDVRMDFTAFSILSWVGLASLTMFPSIFLCRAVYDWWRPASSYHYFVCHHKARAAAQARLIQMLIEQHSHRNCFIDSDDLTNLGDLFDMVRCKTHHLLVYLTSATLSRPWCAGEIVMAFTGQMKVTAIFHPSFVAPTEMQLDNMASYLDLTSCNLQSYSITMDLVCNAYRWLLSGAVHYVYLGNERGSHQFTTVVYDVLNEGSSRSVDMASKFASNRSYSGVKQASLDRMSDMLVISSDSGDDEAIACSVIVAEKIQEDFFPVGQGGVSLLCDFGDVDIEDVKHCIRHARAVAVLLSRGTLSCDQQLWLIAATMATTAIAEVAIVPINCPSFDFPGLDYFTTATFSATCNSLGMSSFHACPLFQDFFLRISVPFSPHASDTILNAQAQEILNRTRQSASCIPRCVDFPAFDSDETICAL